MRVTIPRVSTELLAYARHRGRRSSERATDPYRNTSVPIRMILASEMAKAKRNGGWFRLTRLERGVFSLALHVQARFESLPLVRAIVSVLKKLKEVSHPLYERILRGMEIANAFSEAATQWGNPAAKFWKNDRAYALFLGRFLSGAGIHWG